jgi:hypothetical protein
MVQEYQALGLSLNQSTCRSQTNATNANRENNNNKIYSQFLTQNNELHGKNVQERNNGEDINK